MGFLLLQKIMRNAYYFTVVNLLEKHGVSVSEKNLVLSFNVIVFKVDGLDRGAELVISFPLFVDTFCKLLSLQNKQFVTSPIFCINSNVQYLHSCTQFAIGLN